jgi:hypothetical protein
LVRDSEDFERRIYSSTPDTSMHGGGGAGLPAVANSKDIYEEYMENYEEDGEFDAYGGDENDDNDEQEVSIHLAESPTPVRRITNSNNKPLASSDVFTEKDEDTFNNMSDHEH